MTDDDRTRGIPQTPHTSPIPLRKPQPQQRDPRAGTEGAVVPAPTWSNPDPGYPSQGHPAQGPPPQGYPQYAAPGYGPSQGYAPPVRYAPQQQYAYGSTTIMTRPAPNVALIVIAWVIATVTFFYMLPWAIAATRGKSNQLAIGLVNFLLGWSLIGWIVALVMACGAEPHQTIVVQQNNYGNGPQRY